MDTRLELEVKMTCPLKQIDGVRLADKRDSDDRTHAVTRAGKATESSWVMRKTISLRASNTLRTKTKNKDRSSSSHS